MVLATCTSKSLLSVSIGVPSRHTFLIDTTQHLAEAPVLFSHEAYRLAP